MLKYNNVLSIELRVMFEIVASIINSFVVIPSVFLYL